MNHKKCNCCGDENGFVSLNMVQNIDPTRTLTIRKKFVSDITKRFKQLSKLIKNSIVENDCFGLKGKEVPFAFLMSEVEPRKFDFPTNIEKHEAFMIWLREQQDEGILELIERKDRIGILKQEPWTNIYVDHAYQKGIRRGRAELRKAGVEIPDFGDTATIGSINVAFNQPVHAERLALLYTRTYEELKGITSAMDQAISRILADGLAAGLGAERLAKSIESEVKNIGINRARMLARTEVIRAHHKATIQEYRNLGIEKIIVKAEFSTAGDLRVCQKCRDLNGKIFTLDEIENLIPVHPNCRCVALPYFPKEEEKTKKKSSDKWNVYEGEVLNTPKKVRKAIEDFNLKTFQLESVKNNKKRINELSNEIDALYTSDLTTIEIAKKRFKLDKEIQKIWGETHSIKMKGVEEILRSPIKSDIEFIISSDFGELDLKVIKEEIDKITDWLGYSTFDFPSCYIRKTGISRSHYSNYQINLSPSFSKGTTAHEIGHWLEDQIPGGLEKTKKFLEKRTGDNPLLHLGDGFGEREYYREGGFKNKYAGKDYSRDPNDRSTVYATEVLSVGLELLYSDPIAFAYEDPEFFEFIIRLIKDM